MADKNKTTKAKRITCREALRNLVRFMELDEHLYDGDDDGALGRLMYTAKLSLTSKTPST
jgi:hypothetical protein